MTMHRANIIGGSYFIGEKEYSGTDAVGKICRDLVTGVLEVYRGDLLVLTINIDWRKNKSLSDNDKRIGYVNYNPFPENFLAQGE